MINVDRVYQRVLTLANKEQRGYITPQEFNLFANQVQMDIFEQYFYYLNQFRKAPGNDTVHADMVDILEEKIGVFETTLPLPVTGGGVPLQVIASLDNLPRFYRLTNVRAPVPANALPGTGPLMESVSKKDFHLFLQSPLASPTTSRPIYIVDRLNNLLRIASGRTYSRVVVDYIRSPRDVVWTYIVVGEKALYNATAPDAMDFDLHPSEETELVLKILTLASVTLKDEKLYGAAAGEDAKNIQQEKI